MQDIQPRFFQANIIIVIYAIDTHNGLPLFEQQLREMKSDKTCCAGDKNAHEKLTRTELRAP
jgi:hypothetical protein